MIPVFQTVVGYPRGNCQAAALASIMEVDLNEIPDPVDEPWDGRCQAHASWLLSRGFYMLTFPAGDNGIPIPGYSIAAVPSQKFEGIQHAVVMFDGRIVHDPREDNDPYPSDTRPFDYTLIIPCDPSTHRGPTK